ncbi:2-amino-4-hydroxy-6-hydroxymethyldihydropteridine diphosphokinase [Porphyromonadaceae bacterium W3.11]|nr:2-amino-4-hydroxy-6-hydroxymethyldihydropteridine diphosphokinase [Porphyromonadaceae bacterium W3.11]
MTTVYLALGANLGDRRQQLEKARQLINERVGQIERCSEEYETEPVGFVSEHPFINQAIKVVTDLEPFELLRVTQEIELDLGRDRKSENGQHFDRTCDIDIILYGDLILDNEKLQIPHPHFRERRFVLRPMLDIAANVIDPVTHKSIMELEGKQNG